MTRRVHSAVAWLLLCSLLLVNLPLLSPGAAAQKLLPVEQHEQVIKVLARHLAAGVEMPDRLLKGCGFRPAVGPEAWSRFPPADKIETAYHVAEAASPGEGGEVWLALLSQKLAQLYDAAAGDPLLRQLGSGGKVDCPSFNAPKPVYRSALPARHRAAVGRLASYCGAGAMGYIADTVARELNIPHRTARELFTRHGYDVETGLLAAFEMVPGAQRLGRQHALHNRIASRYESAAHDELLAELKGARAPRPSPLRIAGTPGVAAAAPTPLRLPPQQAEQPRVDTKGFTFAEVAPLSATLEPSVTVVRPRTTATRAPEPVRSGWVTPAEPASRLTDSTVLSNDSWARPVALTGLTVPSALTARPAETTVTTAPSLQSLGVNAPAGLSLGSHIPDTYTPAFDVPVVRGFDSINVAVPRTGLAAPYDPVVPVRLSTPAGWPPLTVTTQAGRPGALAPPAGLTPQESFEWSIRAKVASTPYLPESLPVTAAPAPETFTFQTSPAPESFAFRPSPEPEPLSIRPWLERTLAPAAAPAGLDLRNAVQDFLRERALTEMVMRRANEAVSRSRALSFRNNSTLPDCETRPKVP